METLPPSPVNARLSIAHFLDRIVAIMQVSANGIQIEYDTFGDPSDPPVLLIMGLGTQMIGWHPDFCNALAAHGHFVVRFDNRDVGLSEKVAGGKVDIPAILVEAISGRVPDVPYRLSDMAADAEGLLAALGLESAHVVGVSMGGMIAQQFALDFPERTKTLTSIMSTTGDPGVGAPSPEASSLLFRSPPAERQAAIDDGVASRRITSPHYFDETEARQFTAESYDRSFYPEGTGRQLAAILGSGNRSEDLKSLDVPALVIHGRLDPLVGFDGGQATAAAIPDAKFVAFDLMGHDLPRPLMGDFVDLLSTHFDR